MMPPLPDDTGSRHVHDAGALRGRERVGRFRCTQVLFAVPRIVLSNFACDVTADGQRVVTLLSADLDPSPLTMVVRAVVR